MSIGVEVGTDLLWVHRVTIGKLKSKVSNKLNSASALAALPSILTLLDFNHSATDCPPMRKSARSLCGISIVASASGILESITPGMAQVDHTPHLPQGPPGSGPPVSFARSGLPPPGIRNSEACLNWRKRATFRSDGRAGLECVILA